ncbi:MAG: hypothetical protein KDC57_21810 [Saprospiraceae bacterium]|nr:hypothetical protein [Saprospiraceae bacterium]
MDPTIEQRQRWTSLLTQIQHEILTWRKVGSELLNRRPGADRWCLYEIIDHLDKVNRSYFPQLAAIENGSGQVLRGPRLWWGKQLGKFILKSVQPDNPKRVKTFPVWVPNPDTFDESTFTSFVTSQQQMISGINGSGAAVRSNVKLTSPANKHIYYPAVLAFEIIVTHQLRHLRQGQDVLSSLANSAPSS